MLAVTACIYVEMVLHVSRYGVFNLRAEIHAWLYKNVFFFFFFFANSLTV